MKVLASDAIQDPTKVEAKVRREVKARRVKHEKTNEARKLTHEQRKEKEENQKVKEEDKGLYGAVFKFVPFAFAFIHSFLGRFGLTLRIFLLPVQQDQVPLEPIP